MDLKTTCGKKVLNRSRDELRERHKLQRDQLYEKGKGGFRTSLVFIKTFNVTLVGSLFVENFYIGERDLLVE